MATFFSSHRAAAFLPVLRISALWMVLGGVASASQQGFFESPDLDIADSLLQLGVDVAAIPAFQGLGNYSCSTACAALETIYGADGLVRQAEQASAYDAFTASFWSTFQSDVQPACAFFPTAVADVSVMVLVARLTQCPFAVRSGGHTAFAGASNVADGITLSFARMKGIALSANKTVASVQPGNTWNEIYTELGQHDVAVVGGRLAGIGVGGYTVSGGISYLSNLYGLAVDNVASYEIVTASGTAVTASPTEHQELYWAIRGGGTNFGIVVNFDLMAYPLPGNLIWGGTRMALEPQIPAVIEAFAQLVDDGPQDPKAGGWVVFAELNGTKIVAAETYYAEPNAQDAAIFSGYRNISWMSDTTMNRTLTSYSAELQAGTPAGSRELFYTMTTKLTKEMLQTAYKIWFEELPSVSDVPSLLPTFVYQGITGKQLENTARNGGNPLGISVEDGPLLLIHILVTWSGTADDDKVQTFASRVLSRIKAEAVTQGAQNDYVYMNYASQFQDVIASYGEDNRARLVEIAAKYDPTGVFQTLQPGGFKLSGAPSPSADYFSF